MNFLLITLILLFYIFFFLRSYFLSKSIGKKIKADNILLNTSILFAGITSVIFLVYLIFPSTNKYLFILLQSDSLTPLGAVLISIGLIISSIASLSLGKSWRIGFDDKERTDLVTSGIYKMSRNPYFLSYDIVLIGMVLCLLSAFLVVTASITIVLFHAMILKEEEYLESIHQENYIKYKKEVRRYI